MYTLIYIGDDFYQHSQTRLGVLYTTHGIRSDWGQVKGLLRAGHSVLIRPATPPELDLYAARLQALLADGQSAEEETRHV